MLIKKKKLAQFLKKISSDMISHCNTGYIWLKHHCLGNSLNSLIFVCIFGLIYFLLFVFLDHKETLDTGTSCSKVIWLDFGHQIESNLENGLFKRKKGFWIRIRSQNPILGLIWIKSSVCVVQNVLVKTPFSSAGKTWEDKHTSCSSRSVLH